jgi:hypothetical protein
MDGHNIKGKSSQLFAVSELPITPSVVLFVIYTG